MHTTYPSDLSDTEWECLQQYLCASQSNCRTRRQSLRSILNAIFYVLRTGCPWRYSPSSFPPWQTVFYHFRRFRLQGRWTVLFTALHDAERQRVGRDSHRHHGCPPTLPLAKARGFSGDAEPNGVRSRLKAVSPPPAREAQSGERAMTAPCRCVVSHRHEATAVSYTHLTLPTIYSV